MPAAFDYAERICGRLARRLQELREAAGLSRYALAQRARVSRDTIGDIENGRTIPTFHFGARLAHGLNLMQAVLDKLDELSNALRQ